MTAAAATDVVEAPPSPPTSSSLDLSILMWIFGMSAAFFGAIAISTSVMMAASGMVLEGVGLATCITAGLLVIWSLFALSAHATGE